MLHDADQSAHRSLQLLGLTNSLSARSLNLQALLLAQECVPSDMELVLHDLRPLPFYEAEVEERGIPDSVHVLGLALAKADGVVLSSPEYNHSIPPILKNAIDWCSRLSMAPLKDKPVMLLSATPGMLGGARVQYELRRVLDAVRAVPMVQPEVFIGAASAKFDQQGRCVDAATRAAVSRQLIAFRQWILRTRRAVHSGAEQA